MAIWEAREATIKVGAVVAAIQTSSTLLTQMSAATDYTNEAKNIAITGGERDVESIPLLGTTSGYTNQEIFQKSTGSLREVSLTMVYKDADLALLGSGTVSTDGTASGYTRVQGDQAVVQRAVLLSFNSGTDYVNILLNNAYPVKIGDIKIEADGHAEQELVYKCLAKDYYEEDNLA
jgi:hypothetical protein